MPANTFDFLGEGTNAGVTKPYDPNDEPNPMNPGGVSNNELARIKRGNTGSVTEQRQFENANIAKPPVLQQYQQRAGQTVQVIPGNTDPQSPYQQSLGTVTPQGFKNGAQQLGFTPGGGADTALGSGSVGDYYGNDLQSGDKLVDNVLATQPAVKPENAVTPENRDRLTPVIDPGLAQNDETDRALAMSQDLVDRVLNTPLQSTMLADQALSNQLALGRTARGGAGAQQEGIDAAQRAAPGLLQQGTQAALQEQVARAGAAGQAASIYAGVASGGADRAVRIGEANSRAGLSVLNNLTQLTGLDYQFDTAKMQSIGQLARDYFSNAQAFRNMDTQLQIAEWNNATQKYGIDKTFEAAVNKIAADENVGPLDAFKMVLGIGEAIGGLAL